MKRKTSIMMLILCNAAYANAQTALQTSKIFDNIYIGAQIGANSPLTFDQAFPLNTPASFRIGKDIPPVWGVNLEAGTWLGDHCTGYTNGYANHLSTGNTKFKAGSLQLNGTINLSNVFSNYTGKPRTFELSVIAGIGYIHIFDRKNFVNEIDANGKVRPTGSSDNNELLTKTGLDLFWNIGSEKAWQVYLEPSVLLNITNGGHHWKTANHTDDGVGFTKTNAYCQLALGVNYKFMTSNGTHNFKLYDIGDLNRKINDLNNKINDQ